MTPTGESEGKKATKPKTTRKKAAPKKKLVIVESPSKAKTIEKFLGSGYRVVASVGHVRDLPKSKMGIDIEDDFEPKYINIRGKGDIIKSLKKEAKAATKVFLATDPDREGEAISWHLAFLLGIDGDAECRVVFNEITKDAIKEAIKKPQRIDEGLVDAQQARRVLDRLVGYQISPLLWRKVGRGLSAGRVQSAALKMICDREREIKEFTPEEYWTIYGEFKKGKSFQAKLLKYQGKKIAIDGKEKSDVIISQLLEGEFSVKAVNEKERRRKPSPPFITSSMQQEASTKLGFLTRRTMTVAQQLYEGIKVAGVGTVGLITYMRTDSVRIAPEARKIAESFIRANYGSEYYGGSVFLNKKKDIQDAHEAIRPADVNLTPEQIKDSLSSDQYKLYKLIWNRYVASQMTEALFDSVELAIVNGEYDLSANGSRLKFDGFLKVYSSDVQKDALLPSVEKGEILKAEKVFGGQSFTQPPPRFTEASLVKYLEEKNVGRPSTYVSIISTLGARRYIGREKKSLFPTDLGFRVTEMMEEYFRDIVNEDFTAAMESKLDDVEILKLRWKDIIRDFYGPFEKELKVADEKIEKVEIEDRVSDEKCDKCGKPMLIKMSRYGEFLGCSGYPECKNIKSIEEKIGVSCPKCGHDIIKRKSKKGRLFYGCSGYPKCDMIFWSKPTEKPCPECGQLLVEASGKKDKFLCSNKDCKYKE